MNEPITIVVADDHPLFREGVVQTLNAASDLKVIGEADDAPGALELARNLLPEIILLDVSMPGGGLSATAAINKACPAVRSIMLTVSEDEDIVHQAFTAGASGYVLKGVGGRELVDIVRRVHAGEPYITPSLAASLLQTASHPPQAKDEIGELTPRERDILGCLAEGMSNKQIASRLHMGERTVKHHMTNILQKLRVKNRVEAALIAQRKLPLAAP
jgi:two-component system nitrate/nitrite response regulator NarL